MRYSILKSVNSAKKRCSSFGLGYSNKYSDDLYQYLKKQGYEDELLKDSRSGYH